ncbi:MAG: hypothetical protein RSB51_01415 [Clostridia bacterium]
MNIIVSKIPIAANIAKQYTGCTSDGKSVYLVSTNLAEIHRFNNMYLYESKLDMDMPYSSITYNKNADVFYLSTEDNSIVCLDKNFKNSKGISPNILKMYKDKITSIAYSEDNNVLYIVNKKDIIAVQMETMEIELITEKINNEEKDITFTAAYNKNSEVYIAYTKNSKCFLAKLNKENKVEEEFYVADDAEINNIFVHNNILKLFIVGNTNYIVETNIIENKPCNYYREEFSAKRGSYNQCYANYENPECECSNCCCCCLEDSESNYEQNISDIIESIALEEAGISHILNAEGEKIQKVLEHSRDICEILKVNESVNKTISNVTMLEQILVAKLEIVHNMINKKC